MTKYLKDNAIIFFSISVLIFLYLVRGILLPFILGSLIAYFLGHITTQLTKIIKNRKIASIFIVATVTILIVMFFIFIIPVVLNQLINLIKEIGLYLENNTDIFVKKINDIMITINPKSKFDLDEYISEYSNSMMGHIVNFANNLLSKSFAFLSLLSLLIITPVTAFYFLSEWNNIIRIIKLYLPKKNKVKIEQIFKDIDTIFSACIKGQLTVCFLLGLFYGTLLGLSKLEYGFLIGLLTGLASFIPYFGMIIGFIVAMIVSLYQFGMSSPYILIIITIFILGQILESQFLTPKIVGKKINLHPLWVIFALFSGSSLFGFLGLLIALPIAGIIGVLVRFVNKERIAHRRILYER